MKKYFTIFSAMVLLIGLSMAAAPPHEQGEKHSESGCPAHQASEQGYTAIHDFHEIMAPAWHNAYPDKDYAALLAAGAQFKERFKAIAALKPNFSSAERKKAFMEERDKFAKIVAEYAAAAEKGDKETVYKLMPELHEAFEMTAKALLSIPYPEMEGITKTLNLILKTHLPKNNTEGIVNSTKTLVAKCNELTAESIPEELKGKKEEILKEFAAMKELARQMEQHCQSKDLKTYHKYANQLYEKIKEFFKEYL